MDSLAKIDLEDSKVVEVVVKIAGIRLVVELIIEASDFGKITVAIEAVPFVDFNQAEGDNLEEATSLVVQDFKRVDLQSKHSIVMVVGKSVVQAARAEP